MYPLTNDVKVKNKLLEKIEFYKIFTKTLFIVSLTKLTLGATHLKFTIFPKTQ